MKKRTLEPQVQPETATPESAAAKSKRTRAPKAEKKTPIGPPVLPQYCGRKNPFHPTAWLWVNNENAFVEADKPLCFISPSIAFDIANAQGRPLNIEQVQYMVQLDGDPRQCAHRLLQGEENPVFQPIRYMCGISPNSLDEIRSGASLEEVKTFFGGCYYIREAKNEAVSVSGSVFHYVGHKHQYLWNGSSPLVALAKQMGGNNSPKWGVPMTEVQRFIEARQRKAAINEVAGKLAQGLTNGRPDHKPKKWANVGENARFERLKERSAQRNNDRPSTRELVEQAESQ